MSSLRMCGSVLILALAACPFEREAKDEDEDSSGAPVTAGTSAWPLVYTSTGHPVTAVTSTASIIQTETEVETLTNNYRASQGLDVLMLEPPLSTIARAHSEHMIVHAF